jgi:hypothetical protein
MPRTNAVVPHCISPLMVAGLERASLQPAQMPKLRSMGIAGSRFWTRAYHACCRIASESSEIPAVLGGAALYDRTVVPTLSVQKRHRLPVQGSNAGLSTTLPTSTRPTQVFGLQSHPAGILFSVLAAVQVLEFGRSLF